MAQYHPTKAATYRSERRQVAWPACTEPHVRVVNANSEHGRTRLAAMQLFSWPR
ncbi:hypothetical protein XMIN_2374 [Xanthomonas citri pv. mangiferaeindicae LMG 941]|nr:hypothetical protein XMIN_2374 [Xanthomonas citri pv. mangiferaeindicae LMG 941]